MAAGENNEGANPKVRPDKLDSEFERSLHELRRLADFYDARGYKDKARDITNRLNRISFGGSDRNRQKGPEREAHREDAS